MVFVDAYSRWPEIYVTEGMQTSTLLKCLRNIFARYGIAETLVSDNGPSLVASDVEDWLFNVGCRHLTYPEYHPQSNGLPERMVRTFKEFFRVNRFRDLRYAADKFLLSYRTVRHAITGASPAVLFLRRQLRTSAEILSGTAYSKLPLKKELQKSHILHRAAKLITLDDGNHQVRRHLDQIKVIPDIPETSLRTTMDNLPGQDEQSIPENVPEEETEPEQEQEHNVVDNTPLRGIALSRVNRVTKPIDRLTY